MPQGPFNVPPVDADILNVLKDFDGSDILRLGVKEYEIVNPDSSRKTFKINESIRLVCGRTFNFADLARKDAVYLAVCHFCRNTQFSIWRREEATHGIMALENAKSCEECGMLLCPKHVAQYKDGKWRCQPCAKKNSIKRFFRAIFYSSREE